LAPGPVWTCAKNLAPPGFNPRTVQPVVSRYTDLATGPTEIVIDNRNNNKGMIRKVAELLAFQGRLCRHHETFPTNLTQWQELLGQAGSEASPTQ
jgi:hypothetical protein